VTSKHVYNIGAGTDQRYCYAQNDGMDVTHHMSAALIHNKQSIKTSASFNNKGKAFP
jgi:hypothetical protein